MTSIDQSMKCYTDTLLDVIGTYQKRCYDNVSITKIGQTNFTFDRRKTITLKIDGVIVGDVAVVCCGG